MSSFLGCVALAAEPPADATLERKPPLKAPQWTVRVEVLTVVMPQDKALALLPDLRAPEKIDGAVAQIMTAIGSKEASLIGNPVVYTLDGVRGVAETILEKRYPTEFEPPQMPQNAAADPQASSTALVTDNAIPTSFETRNLGVSLEVEPRVISPGNLIRLDVVSQRVVLLRFDSYDAVKAKSGAILKIDQPQFATTKTTAAMVLRNGQRSLLAIHKLFEPENHIELSVIQAFISPIK